MQDPLNFKNHSSEITCRCTRRCRSWVTVSGLTEIVCVCVCVLDYTYGCNTLTWIEYRDISRFALPPETLIPDDCIRLGYNVVSLYLWLPTLRRK
jgi:hypothetical protein